MTLNIAHEWFRLREEAQMRHWYLPSTKSMIDGQNSAFAHFTGGRVIYCIKVPQQEESMRLVLHR